MGGNLKKQMSIIVFVYFGQLSVGHLSGWTAPAIPKLQDPDETPLSSVLTDGQASFLGSMVFVGVIIGSHIAGWLSNLRGRKPCFLIGGITIMTSYLLLDASVNFWMLLGAKFLLTVGGGMVFITNFAYIAEISSTNIRGILLTGCGIANAAGIVFGYCVGPYVTYFSLNNVGFLIAMVFTIGVMFIPETPAFFVMKGKEIEAKTTLILLGRSEDIEDVLSCKSSPSQKDSWKSILTIKSNRKAVLIAAVLLICQQTSGFSCVLLFGTSIFQSVKSTISPAVATIVIGVTQLLASCITPMFVERVGRKILMLVTTAVCFFALILLGIYFCLETQNQDLATKVHWLPLLSIILHIFSYTVGFGIIPGTWMSEMFDSTARGPGSATAMTISWVFGFLVTSTFSLMISTLGSHWTFWIYSLSCLLAFVFTAVVVPETKGKTLTEIQYMLSK